MARQASRYVCQECGAVFPKWSGKCDACGEWNSIVEEQARPSAPRGLGAGQGAAIDFVPLAGSGADAPRLASGIAEFDRVTGGGLVGGSALLVGGDPGIGKSTMLLQVAGALARTVPVVYISGEEAIDQIRLRARRLGLGDAPVGLAAATSVRDIATTLESGEAPQAVVVDSIQTMYVDTLESAPGTVAQVRASAQELIQLAKRRGFCLLLVGHVTKDGSIAGPRVLEHMVDGVFYFEGRSGHEFRLLRGLKNRFGPTDEIGVFEMTGRGLIEVANPSALFLAERQDDVPGAAVFAGMEGTRPVLVEIQALVAPSPLATPRRAVVGWDSARLAMVLAVLETRCGIGLAGRDVYLNVAGGMRIAEPAADLAVAGAVLSAASDRPAPPEAVMFGEVGLGGEVRGVGRPALRLREAAKLGFSRAIAPARGNGEPPPETGIEVTHIGHLNDLVAMFGPPRPARDADWPQRREA